MTTESPHDEAGNPASAAPRAQLPAALVADLNKWAEDYAHEAGAGTREALARTEREPAGSAA